jgi:hypothetical protein
VCKIGAMKAGGRGLTVVCALAILGSLGGAPVAAADTAVEVQRATTSAWVFLGGNGDYEIAIVMPNPRVAVLVVVERTEPRTDLVVNGSAYAVRAPAGMLEHGVVRARFPGIGNVSLRFHPRGKRQIHRNRRHCRGRPGVTESGTFQGTVSLQGEGGYFRKVVGSGSGTLERSFRLRCRPGSAYHENLGAPLWQYVAPSFLFSFDFGHPNIALLYAAHDDGRRFIAIRASHREGSLPGAEVRVGALETLPGMAIGRMAYLERDVPGVLQTSPPGIHPATATLAPPPPFHGEAHYFENSATSHSWTGDLAVSFPGLDLPLTGTGFQTSLCVVSPLKTPAGCDFIKPKPLRPERANVLRWWRGR